MFELMIMIMIVMSLVGTRLNGSQWCLERWKDYSTSEASEIFNPDEPASKNFQLSSLEKKKDEHLLHLTYKHKHSVTYVATQENGDNKHRLMGNFPSKKGVSIHLKVICLHVQYRFI